MGYKILLIDHDPQVSERIGKPLAEAGHEFATASDAHEAIEAFESVRPDLTLVVEDSGDLPAAALCVQLKNTEHGRGTPFVFLAHELPPDRDELQRRIEHFGCDRMVDRSVSGEQLLRLCTELLESQVTSVVSAHEQIATAKLLGSEELSDAVEKFDTVSNHRAASVVPTADPPADSATTQSLPAIKELNRDAPSAEAFGDPLQPALNGAPPSVATSGLSPAGIDDSGEDIAEHLDSLFSSGLPASPEASKPSPPKTPVAPRAIQPAAKPAKPSPPPQQAVAKAKPAAPPAPVAKAKPAPPPAPAPKTPTRPPMRAKPQPPAKPGGSAPKASAAGTVGAKKPMARPAPPPAAPVPSPAPVAREAPKAVEQLRLPHVPAPTHTKQREWRSRIPLAGWIAAAVVGIGLLAAGAYFAFVRESDPVERPRIARAPQTEPAAPKLPTPPPLEPLPVSEEVEPSTTTRPPVEVAAAAEKPAQSTKPEAVPSRPSSPPQWRPEATAKPPAEAAPTVPEARTSAEPPVVATDPAPATARKPEPEPAEVPAPAPAVPRAGTAAAAAAPAEPSESAPTPPPAVPEVKPPLETTRASVDPASQPEPQTVPTPPAETTPSPQPVEEEPPAQVPAFEPPAVVDRVEPSYSPKALKGVENPVVVLRLLVDEQGKIARVLVDEGIPGSELEAAAVSAVLRWRFRPATEDGAPVKAWTTVRFVFEP